MAWALIVHFTVMILSPKTSFFYLFLKRDNIYGNYLKIMRTIGVVIAVIAIGIFIGIIIIILFTNLILFWSTKDSTYIYYCAYLFFAGSLILSIYGTLFELFLPNQTWINNPLILLGSSTATIISYALFSSKYLDIKKFYKRWNIILNVIIYLSILSFFYNEITLS